MPIVHQLDNRYFIQTGGVGNAFADKNNCAVRALANALGWSVEQGSNYMREFGRIKNKGSTMDQFLPAYKLAKFDKISVFGRGRVAEYASEATKVKPTAGITFGNLLNQPKYKKGTHIVIVTKHAVCIKDGQPIDFEGSVINKNRRVIMTFSKE